MCVCVCVCAREGCLCVRLCTYVTVCMCCVLYASLDK